MNCGPFMFQWACFACSSRSIASASRWFKRSITWLRVDSGRSLSVACVAPAMVGSGLESMWSALLDERAVAQLGVGAPQLRLGIHDDGSLPRHRLRDRPAGDEQEADALFARLYGDLVARIEQHERAVAGELRRAGGVPDPFGPDRAGGGGVAEAAAALEDVGKGVVRRFDGQRFAHPRRYPHIEVAGIGGDAVHGTRFTPEAAASNPHPLAVVVHYFRDVGGRDVLR